MILLKIFVIVGIIINDVNAQTTGTLLSQQDDDFLKQIHKFGNIYSYNQTFDIKLITNDGINEVAANLTEILYDDWNIKDEMASFHFDDIMGYTIEKDMELCINRCESMKNEGCVGVNYVDHVHWCVLTRSYAPAEIIGGNGHWHDSTFFYFSDIAKLNRDYSTSKQGILPTKLGEPYFRPYGFENRRARIVGGIESKPFSLPWLTHLSKGESRCTSFLINQNPESDIVGDSSDKIITAAHCVNEFYDHVVKLGTHRVDIVELHEVQLRVKSVIIHENYDGSNVTSDIAIIKLEKPVKFSEYIRPVALPRVDVELETINSMNCFATGWGRLIDDEQSQVLNQLLAIEIAKCDNQTWPTAICIESNKTRGIGHGDSGGPLLCHNRTSDQFIAYGVANTEHQYTYIREFMPWIIKSAKAMDNSDIYIPQLATFHHHPQNAPIDEKYAASVVKMLKKVSDIYHYPEKHNLTQILDKPDITDREKVSSSFKFRIGFHFDDVIGFTIETSVYNCIRRCDAHQDCQACNYIETTGACFFLKSATLDQNSPLWSTEDGKSVHIYFTGPIKRAIQAAEKQFISIMSITEPGKAYFRPAAASLDISFLIEQQFKPPIGFRTAEFEITTCDADFQIAEDQRLAVEIDRMCHTSKIHHWKIGDLILIPMINGNYKVYSIEDFGTNRLQTLLLAPQALSDGQITPIQHHVFDEAVRQLMPNFEVEPHSLPWMVEVVLTEYEVNRPCNGILLADSDQNKHGSMFVLTTRECLLNAQQRMSNPDDITVKFASHRNDLFEKHEFERKAKTFIEYQNDSKKIEYFTQETLVLIALADQVPFSHYVAPIEVRSNFTSSNNNCSECFMAGWLEKTDMCGDVSLVKTHNKKGGNATEGCELEDNANSNVTVKESTLFTFFVTTKQKPCKINMGAPLICFDSNAEKYFVKTFVDYYSTTTLDNPLTTFVNMSGVEMWLKRAMESYKETTMKD